MGLIERLYKLVAFHLCLYQAVFLKLSSSESLYKEKDSVITLDEENFGYYVYDQNAFTLVNFYADWCGHCQRFAPIWLEFADNINSWKTIVRVAAVNCADNKNTELCLKHVVQSYPRVHIFAINAQTNDLGLLLELHNHTVPALRSVVIDFLLKSQKSFSNRLNIFPISVISKEELYNTLPIHLEKHNLIFVERHPSNLGVEVIMDFSSHTETVSITRVHDITGNLANNLFSYYIHLPSLIQIHRNHRIDFIASALSENQELLRKEFGAKIRSLLHIETSTIVSNISMTTDNRVIIPKKLTPLSMTDLYNTLRYSLYDEMSRFNTLNETQIVVLKKYISVIYKYFPFDNENVRRFFKRMNNWFSNKTNNVTIVNLRAAMKISDGYLLPIVSWKHCNGSKPHLRRYPCGLWSLFHVMTVKEYTASEENSHEVLHTMREFIVNLFSCETCAKHFGEVSKDLDSHLVRRESSVLWLWRVHNQVNVRLKGDASEDPYFPKVQYPTPAMCHNCSKSNSEFDEENVLQFLINHYDEKNFFVSNSQVYNSNKTFLFFYFIIQYSLYFFNAQ